MSGRALFVAYGGGHIAMVLPVLRAVRALAPSLECVLLALTNGYEHAVAAGERPLGYRNLLHLVDRDRAVEWGRRLAEGNRSPDVAPEESIAYLGANYLDLQAQYGEEGAAERYAQRGRYTFLPLRFMDRLLDMLQPSVVVATNSPRSEQAALETAVRRGIPTVGMVDLFGMDSDTFVLREVKPLHTCVIAESVRQRLVDRGFPPEGVHVTGNPAFDGLFDPAVRAQAAAWRQARGWADKKVVLYIGAWEPVAHPGTTVAPGRGFPIEIEGILRRYVAQRPDTALVVRYHPGDWFEYPRQPDESRVYFSVPPAEPIHPLILAADVVVNTNSTVGLEAAVAGKPVVSIENSPSVLHWFSLAQLGVSYPSPTHHDLGATLDAVLAHGKPLQAYRSDGQAARRVAEVVVRASQGLT